MLNQRNVVVLGGGISGLSLAWFLNPGRAPASLVREALVLGNEYRSLRGGRDGRFANRENHVTVIEKEKRPGGGWICSKRVGDDGRFLFECGPHSMRPKGIKGLAVLQLIEELGLDDQVLPTSPACSKRYIWMNNKMHQLPTGPLEALISPLTRTLPLIGLREWLMVPRNTDPDESVHDFFSRRFNEQVAEVLVDSMISGIYAGDSRKLSIRSCFPDLYDMERENGSVVGSMFRFLIGKGSDGAQKQLLRELDRETNEQYRALRKATGISFKDGMQVFPERIVNRLETYPQNRFMFESTVSRIEPASDGKRTRVYVRDRNDKETVIDADKVISTLPIYDLYSMLPKSGQTHLEEMRKSMEHVTVGVVNIAYDKTKLPYAGFGHLIPSKEREGVLGMIYDSIVFPDQMKTEHGACLTVMMGGAHSKAAADFDEQTMIKQSLEKIERHLGISDEPIQSMATRQVNCIPQYHVGHHDRMTRALEGLKREMPNLTVLGNNFHGVGIADCIVNGMVAAGRD